MKLQLSQKYVDQSQNTKQKVFIFITLHNQSTKRSTFVWRAVESSVYEIWEGKKENEKIDDKL